MAPVIRSGVPGRPRGGTAAGATVLGRTPRLKESLSFGSSTAVEQAAKLVTNLVVASMVGPAVWGYWFLLNLVIRYGSLSHLGAINGMSREIPAAVGRGEHTEADRLQHATLAWTGICLLVAGVLAIGAVGVTLDLVDLTHLTLTVVLLCCHQAYAFVTSALKARGSFSTVSAMQYAGALAYPALVLPAAAWWGLSGFIVGQAACFTLLCLVAARSLTGLFVARFDGPAARRLVTIGFPIMLVGVVFTLFSTVDRWVIAARLGEDALGHYSLAIMALAAVALLPQVFSQLTYPRMAASWAARRDLDELARLMSWQRRATLAAVVPISLTIALLAHWGTRTFLPEFVPGATPLLVAMAAPILYSAGQGYGNAMNVLGRQYLYLAALVAATLVNVGVSLALVGPLGLVGVATGTVAGFAALALALLLSGSLVFRRAAQRVPPSRSPD